MMLNMNTEIHIGRHRITQASEPFIIAEAGVNHNGDIELAKQLVIAAKECGADCVKFQTFKAERVASISAPKAVYQMKTTNPQESQLEMLKKLEFTYDEFKEVVQYCREQDIQFLSTPYSIDDADLLHSLDVPAFKIASGQAVEPIFLDHVARKGKPVILSTGMCTLSEVDNAIRIIRDAGNDQIIILQCTTNYPTAPEDANIRAMVTMRNAFGYPTGYSDHTQTSTTAVTAVALGACVIERHLTLDKNMPGPDHSSSSDPGEFACLVSQIRETSKVLGSYRKEPTDVEKENIPGMRRGIFAAVDIPTGSLFTLENLTVKRPLTGLSANYLPMILGHKAACDIKAETSITLEVIE